MEVSTRHRYRAGDLVKGRYAVLAICGAGGMGSVYKVRDVSQKNRVLALKVLGDAAAAEDKSAVERFRREAMVSSELIHPNIVHVFDWNFDGSEPPTMVMEFVPGMTLSQRIASKKLSPLTFDEMAKILREICAGLAHAHARGVIHRDLKPANILLSETGAKIADFGLCRSESFIDHELTQTGQCVGTPIYMSPEQIRAGSADSRSDVYAFGILAFELVTGSPPFKGSTWFEIGNLHLKAPLPPLAPTVPEWLRVLIEVCTAKDPSARFANAVEMLEAIDEQLYTSDVSPSALRRSRGKPLMAALCGALCFALVILGGVYSGIVPDVMRKLRGTNELPPATVTLPRPAAPRASSPKRPEQVLSAPKKLGKVMMCRRPDGKSVVTNDPPKGAECIEMR